MPQPRCREQWTPQVPPKPLGSSYSLSTARDARRYQQRSVLEFLAVMQSESPETESRFRLSAIGHGCGSRHFPGFVADEGLSSAALRSDAGLTTTGANRTRRKPHRV